MKELLGRVAGGAGFQPSPFASLPGFPAVAFEEGAFDSLGRHGGEPEFAFVPDADEPAYEEHFEDVPYEIEEDTADEPEPAALPADGSALRLGAGPLPTMEEVEQTLIAEALHRFDGNRRQTAKALGISERTLYRKIKDLEAQGVEV